VARWHVDHVLVDAGPLEDRERAVFTDAGHALTVPAVIRCALVLTDVVDDEDVRVIERARRASFLFEAAEPIGSVGDPRGQYLDRDVPAQAAVPRAIDLAHAPFADGSDHLVRTETCTGGEGHGGSG